MDSSDDDNLNLVSRGEGDCLSPQPLVSVAMPVRNESQFIRRNLLQLMEQDYPHDSIEIIIADGMSDDGTREIIAELQTQDSRIRLIDNPQSIVPTGLNAAIQSSQGAIVIRVDGHVEVAKDFIRSSVDALRGHSAAWGAGGPIVHEGKTLFGKAVAAAMSHPAGVGNASHRFANFEGYGEGTAFPAFYRWVFDRVGFYDESLVRNQDDEFYFRVLQAGGKFFITPKIRYVYFVRGRVSNLFWQYFQYSFWRIPIIRKHGRPTTLRQVLPTLFWLLMLVLACTGLILGNYLLAVGLPVLYVLTLAAIGFFESRVYGLRVGILMPVAMIVMHCAYATGMLCGAFAFVFAPNAWTRKGKMARLTR